MLTRNAYSSRHLVQSHLGLAYVVIFTRFCHVLRTSILHFATLHELEDLVAIRMIGFGLSFGDCIGCLYGVGIYIFL